MFKGKELMLVALTCLVVSRVGAIVSKPESKNVLEENNGKKGDNEAAQSIDRDYIAGYEDHYGHGGFGLSAHTSYGYPEGYEGYDGGKHRHHHHHLEGHHHHHDDHHHGDDDHHHHHHHHLGQSHHHKHYDSGFHKALAIKGLLVPLAGVALLGAAAAFVSNPVLLQLGVISGASYGRRRRDTTSGLNLSNAITSAEDQVRLNELKLLERFMAQIPKQEIEAQEKKILASYLSCSGMTTDNSCLERLACELHSPEGISMPMEANVLTIVVNEILTNRFVAEATKERISKAVRRGEMDIGCGVYECEEMDHRKDDGIDDK